MIALGTYRKMMNMKGEELGKLVGVSKSTISSWESGKRDIPKDKLTYISHLFKLNPQLIIKPKHELTRHEWNYLNRKAEEYIEKSSSEEVSDGDFMRAHFEVDLDGLREEVRVVSEYFNDLVAKNPDLKQDNNINGLMAAATLMYFQLNGYCASDHPQIIEYDEEYEE